MAFSSFESALPAPCHLDTQGDSRTASWLPSVVRFGKVTGQKETNKNQGKFAGSQKSALIPHFLSQHDGNTDLVTGFLWQKHFFKARFSRAKLVSSWPVESKDPSASLSLAAWFRDPL